tara:strand:- start:14186 stop:14890 length:705 start_codon:yes stop_codon:yes gene_type:complete
MSKYDLSIIIPLYNEEKNVEKVVNSMIKILNQSKINYELILVNNGSKDNTFNIIDDFIKKNKRLKKVDILKNEGYGLGVINGLKKADGRYLGYIDGDGQFSSENIVKIYRKIKNKDLDFCKGLRIKREDGLKREIASFVYNSLVSLFFLVRIEDINSKPKIMKKECYEDLNLQSKDWFIDTEIMIKLKKKGYVCGNVPLEFKNRESGRSNVKVGTIAEFLKNLLSFRFSDYYGK